MSQQQQQQSFRQQPYLTIDLRSALSVLYNLQHHQHNVSTSTASSHDAHEYLLQFQSRNVRRRLHSQFKGQKGAQQQQQQQQLPTLQSEDIGSTWLTCIHLISSLATTDTHTQQQSTSPIHYAEALFAAQTLVHRLRRVKLTEAIDVELEAVNSGSNNNEVPVLALSSFPPRPQFILELYRAWILQSYNDASTLDSLLQKYGSQHFNDNGDLEERIKGEVSMMLLANVVDNLTCRYQAQHPQDSGFSQIRPLLVTLSSALTILAVRIRYTPSSLPDPLDNTLPIVQMILQSFVKTRQHKQHSEVRSTSVDLYYICLAVIPDAVLQQGGGGGGGAFGRFSLDPRCYTAVTLELKTQGIHHVWQSLQEIDSNHPNQSAVTTTSPVLLLNICEAWAKHVPLPNEFVASTIPLILQSWQQHPTGSHQTKAAMAYWIATMESGALTVEQVLLSSLLQGSKGSQQANKKRQSSKSKKREQQILVDRTTESLQNAVSNEVRHRGQIACMMARSTWPAFDKLLQHELHEIAIAHNNAQHQPGETIEEQDEVEGEGPIGAVAACATACLPFMLRAAATGNYQDVSLDLFATISGSLQQMCESPSRHVRGFVSESLYCLYETLVECTVTSSAMNATGDLMQVLVQHFVKCSMNLASRCRYPDGFFSDLGRNNVEELEIERNDVRDVLRTVAAMPPVKSNLQLSEVSAGVVICSSVLQQLLDLCVVAVREAMTTDTLVSEAVLHAFSALAKPINLAALSYSRHHAAQSAISGTLAQILNLALEITSMTGNMIVQKFPILPVNNMLPLSRLYNLSVASLSPMLSALLDVPAFEHQVVSSITIATEAAGMSLLRLPELPSPSTLRSSRFDVRGAMRSPGGEDHVGVLTILRLAGESKALSLAFLRSKPSVLLDLCSLYEELKSMELNRGVGVYWGTGVLPKSRRILLGIICSLDVVAGGDAQLSQRLEAIFEHAVSSITANSDQMACPPPGALFHICESVFDIAAFRPDIANLVFDTRNDNADRPTCIHVLHETTNFGFRVPTDVMTDDTILQWNRLRAAIFTLLKGSSAPDIPSSAVPLLQSLIRVECEAVLSQCGHGPNSTSRVFHEDVISEENIPAGLFIQVLTETLSNAFRSQVPVEALGNALRVLVDARQLVLQTIVSDCSSPVKKESFHDPRPVIAESWLICMNVLCKAMVVNGTVRPKSQEQESVTAVADLLVHTFIAVIALLLYSSLEKKQEKRAEDPGMTLDGPQGLVLMDFLQSYFCMGPEMLQTAASRLIQQIPVETGNNPDAAGYGIIGAVLFRGIQGSLPPWAVESLPSVYSALFAAMGKSVDDFGHMLDLSMSIRLRANDQFGSIRGGLLLSGRFFEKMNDSSRRSFLTEAKKLAKEDSTAAWKRLKVIIKQACGGKKKDTDFNQRPALTRWDTLDRV
ncbi:MAG: hypothetical protein SGILL_001395 [Bacillariaceae sp.]